MKFIHKKTNKRSRKRRTYKNKKYKGGDFIHRTSKCKQSGPSIKELTKYIKEPYKWTIQLYDSTRCHLFIWYKDEKTPHIHVHTFSNETYGYTVNKKTYTVKLYGKERINYESVLNQMYETLTGLVKPDPVFTTPVKPPYGESTTETPTKSERKQDSLRSEKLRSVQIKLGPIMGKERLSSHFVKDGSLIE